MKLDVAWAAGILEGEGCFYMGKPPSSNGQLRFHITCRMTDEDVIRRLHAVFNVGKVFGPHLYQGCKKPSWTWQVYNKNEILDVLRAIRPIMGQRRGNKIDLLMQTLSSHKGVRESRIAAQRRDGKKTCKKCQRSKSLKEYGRDASMADGLRAYCRGCVSVFNARRF